MNTAKTFIFHFCFEASSEMESLPFRFEEKADMCPEHKQTAIGLCLDCNCLVCSDHKCKHEHRNCKIFEIKGLNYKLADVEEECCEYAHLLAQIEAINEVFTRRKAMKAFAKAVKEEAITLITEMESKAISPYLKRKLSTKLGLSQYNPGTQVYLDFARLGNTLINLKIEVRKYEYSRALIELIKGSSAKVQHSFWNLLRRPIFNNMFDE